MPSSPPSRPQYGWVHVKDWLPTFSSLAALGGILLLLNALSGYGALLGPSFLALFLGGWPLMGYLWSWWRRDPDAWYSPLLEAAKGWEGVILDLGCGLGRSTVALARIGRGGLVVGVDTFDARCIWGSSPKRARENAKLERVHDRVEFHVGDARHLPYRDGSFQLVVAAYVSHELRGREDRLAMMKEVARVLRPKGLFIAGEIPRSLRSYLLYSWHGLWFPKARELLLLRREASLEVLDERRMGRFWVIVCRKPAEAR